MPKTLVMLFAVAPGKALGALQPGLQSCVNRVIDSSFSSVIRPIKDFENMLVETLERIRLTAQVPQTDWCDILCISWSDYQKFKAGQKELSEKKLEKLTEKFQLSLESIMSGNLDFVQLAIQSTQSKEGLPERYAKAAFGRRRSSNSSVQYLEDKIGWRLRNDAIQKFEIPEAEIQNPFGPISILFMTDLCSYLVRRGFRYDDFVEMGAYNYEMTTDTLIGQHFSSLRNPGEVYESFFSENLKLFESNCKYTLTKLTSEGGEFEVTSNSDVAQELNVQHLGSSNLCAFKAGHAASLPKYLGLPLAAIRETACVHSGDSCCRFEFTYQPAAAH